jgi:PQQ enzyme repeat
MNIALGATGSKHLTETDGTDISVGWVGTCGSGGGAGRPYIRQCTVTKRCWQICEDCAHSFETDPSSSLDLENRWRRPVSYRSIEFLAIIIDILIILSAGVLADAIYRLATTEFSSTSTDYAAAAAVIAASLLKCRGLYKPMVKVNRGLAISIIQLFFGSLEGFLVAINANTGKVKWQTRVAKSSDGFSLTGEAKLAMVVEAPPLRR